MSSREPGPCAMSSTATTVDRMLALREGDRVVLLVRGGVEYAALSVLLTARGVVPVPLDASLTASEQERLLTTLRPHLVVTDLAVVPAAAEALSRTDGPVTQVLPRCRPMHCTSGTTGVPKGVWSGLLDDAQARALLAEERELWGFHADDVTLTVSPLHHSAPLRFASQTLLAGGRVVLPGPPGVPFDPAAVTSAIERHRVTAMFCVPTHLQRLFAHWDRHGTPDVGSFRLLAHAGAACPPATKERLLKTFPAGTTWEFYGSTEGQFTACPSEEWVGRPGTVGRARPGRHLAVDPDGQIWCSVPEHARFTYFGDPDKTAEAWRETPAGPAFTVGDLGRLDADGYLYLDARREDLIVTGGVNVYPAEVEHVLGELPGVEDVAVFGVPDEDWGQRVCAAYVGEASEESLRSHSRDHLAPAKRPKTYHRLGKLPRTPTGKVRRVELAADVGAV